MAAELEALIQMYRSCGLNAAADVLAMEKESLQTRGLLPPQLDPVVETSGSGCVSIRRERRLHPGDFYDIDMLALRVRTRTALLNAGIGSINELTYVVRQGLLPKIRDIGERSAHEILEKLPRDST